MGLPLIDMTVYSFVSSAILLFGLWLYDKIKDKNIGSLDLPRNGKMKFTIESKMVANAFLDEHEKAIYMEHCLNEGVENVVEANPNVKIGSPVILVTITYENGDSKKVFTCNSGGIINNDGSMTSVNFDDIRLTPTGVLTNFTASLFIKPQNKIIFKEIICACDEVRLTEKIHQTLNFGDDGDLINFVGDMACECDGKISPKLNITGVVVKSKHR